MLNLFFFAVRRVSRGEGAEETGRKSFISRTLEIGLPGKRPRGFGWQRGLFVCVFTCKKVGKCAYASEPGLKIERGERPLGPTPPEGAR